MKNYLLAIIVAFVTISCDKDMIITTPEEDHILELAYSDNYIYPEGFHHVGSAYYVNTLSITPISEREHMWIELNTNDKDEARLWSDKTNEHSSVNREVVHENETDKYFEFERINPNNARDISYSRVHKTSYFQPVLNHFSKSDTLIGKFNGELNLSSVKDLIEYLWDCGTMDKNPQKYWSQILRIYEYLEYNIQSILIVYGDFETTMKLLYLII